MEATGSVNNLGTPCRLLPLPPFAMLKRLENVPFSVQKASSSYNIKRGKGYRPQKCQMSQELLSETVGILGLKSTAHHTSRRWLSCVSLCETLFPVSSVQGAAKCPKIKSDQEDFCCVQLSLVFALLS